MLDSNNQNTIFTLLHIGWKRDDYSHITGRYYYGGLWLIIQNNKVYYSCLDCKAYSKVLLVKSDDKWGVLNSKLEPILPIVYDSISDFENGIAIIEEDRKYGVINETGRIIHSCVYEEIKTSKSERSYRSDESYSIHTTKFLFPKAVKDDGDTVVYLSKEGDVYNTIFERGNCVFIKGSNDKWAVYYDGNITPYIYDAIFKDSEFKDSEYYKVRIHCSIGAKHGVIDRFGNVIIPFLYDKIENVSKCSNHYYVVTIGSNKYFMDDQGIFDGVYNKSLINDDDDWDGNLMSDEDMYRAAFENMPEMEWNID